MKDTAMKRLKRKPYEKQLTAMQLELVAASRWVQATGQRLVVLVEGRDTAGKGGVINAIREHLNPRQCRVAALPTPTERQKTEWYFQRYIPHLPAAGEITLFDRSWYNRAGVEQVMGFATPAQVEAFLRQAPLFEQQLVDDGILVTGGTGFTGRDSTPEALLPLLDKTMPGFGELFRAISFAEIGTSSLQSRAFAGLANGRFLFALPGSTSACRTAWESIIRLQLDAGTRPCNLATLRPRLRE